MKIFDRNGNFLIERGGTKFFQHNHLISADLRGVDLKNANLEGIFLTHAKLNHTNLEEANLKNAILKGAYLKGAILENAILENADLSDADLKDANLRNANLKYADLRGAYLEDTEFEGAILEGTYLEGTYLKGANLTNTCLDQDNLPNMRTTRFEKFKSRSGIVWCIGYRTSNSPHIKCRHQYKIGRLYEAPLFSTCKHTMGHPGLYVVPSNNYFMNTNLKVIFPDYTLHKVGDNYRVKWFIVIEEVDGHM